MLKEEASTREKVHRIQKNLSLALHALGEMGLANPVFCHSQLPSLVSKILVLSCEELYLSLCYRVNIFCKQLISYSSATATPFVYVHACYSLWHIRLL